MNTETGASLASASLAASCAATFAAFAASASARAYWAGGATIGPILAFAYLAAAAAHKERKKRAN